jgi:thioredoxin 2
MAESEIVKCPACGAANRVPLAAHDPGKAAVCGRCRTPLISAVRPMEATDAGFAADVEGSPLPVLLDLWAPWCGPCHMLAPTIDQLAAEFAGRVRVMKLNVDDNPATAARFNARSIPMLLVLDRGREIDRMVGVRPKSDIARRLDELLRARA